MSNTAVAKRYAGALVSLCAEQKCLEPVGKDLQAFGALLAGSDALRASLQNPAFTAAERKAVVGAVADKLKVHAISRSFLLVLVDNGRTGAFADILAGFQTAHDASIGRVRATCTSASELTKTDITALKKQIALWTGANEVLIQTDVDPSLLGGIVTQVGDKVLDGSIRTQLQNLRSSLLGTGVTAEA